MADELSPEQVRHLARLARLELSAEETRRFGAQLSAVLDHVETINRLPTEGVAPTAHALDLSNVLREDEVGPCLAREEVLAAAPEAEAGRFSVPRILDEEP